MLTIRCRVCGIRLFMPIKHNPRDRICMHCELQLIKLTDRG